ncbi:MAG: transporter ATP-binding protein [Sphingobacteriaceae bacterium]|jgi:ABC-2 type transport system ATP-binding protein|nr:transporter ATP-binding protein [Sphingobacteriaceae bacterium]
MSSPIIETHELSYFFGNQQVLDKVSLNVPSGSIYGFLGPNGAGKTTTIKILLNLLRSEAKNVFVFGQELSGNRISVLSRIGSLVEQPAIYGHLSGRENLIVRASLLRLKSHKADEVLELTGLSSAAYKKASQYSLGMKQRLGIGLALLSDPQLLILDEPTNGLDPNGIIEVRKLLTNLAQQGKTVFVSSHLLSEVEKTASHVGIINKGTLIFQGTLQELQHLSNEQVLVEVDDNVRAANILLKNGHSADIIEKQVIVPYLSKDQMAAINTLLVSAGCSVSAISKSKKDLEHLFLSLTQS